MFRGKLQKKLNTVTSYRLPTTFNWYIYLRLVICVALKAVERSLTSVASTNNLNTESHTKFTNDFINCLHNQCRFFTETFLLFKEVAKHGFRSFKSLKRHKLGIPCIVWFYCRYHLRGSHDHHLSISDDRQLISIISAHFKEIPSISSKDFKGRVTLTKTIHR